MNLLEIDRPDFGNAWLHLLHHLVDRGHLVSPRGKAIREITNVSFHVKNGLDNVLISAVRNPSYRFMVAEWLWIWFGHNDVASIVQYNKNIAAFSDDGLTFAGAYGPAILAQWPRVREILKVDPDSRQALIQIYHPPKSSLTKDVPCTISVQFFIRKQELHTVVNMRSSDIWLGLVYDFFNFSMLGNIMAAQQKVKVGSCTFHIGSSHLYEVNLESAHEVLNREAAASRPSPLFTSVPPDWLEDVLVNKNRYVNVIAPSSPWSDYAKVLLSLDNNTALSNLERANGTLI